MLGNVSAWFLCVFYLISMNFVPSSVQSFSSQNLMLTFMYSIKGNFTNGWMNKRTINANRRFFRNFQNDLSKSDVPHPKEGQ